MKDKHDSNVRKDDPAVGMECRSKVTSHVSLNFDANLITVGK